MESKETGNKVNPSSEHKPCIRVKSQSGEEHVYYSLVYEGFPEEFQARAQSELKETPEARKKGLQRLREFMKGQALPPLKDDTLLLATLRNCKYNLKKAETKLKKLMHVRQEIGVRLRNAGMECIEAVLDEMPFGMLPYRDKHGRSIYYTRPYGLLSDPYTVADASTVGLTAQLFMLSYPISSVSGTAYFGECKSPSMYIYYSIFKHFRSNMWTVLQLPMRLARVEVLNENYLCRWFYNVLKPLLSQKICKRVTLHGSDFTEFHEMYDPNILPEDFGGNAGPLSSEVYKQKFMDFARNLIEEFEDKM